LPLPLPSLPSIPVARSPWPFAAQPHGDNQGKGRGKGKGKESARTPTLPRDLQACRVPVAYGSDLLGQLQVEQSRESLLRSEVLSPLEILRSATLVGARVVRQEGKLGCLRPGAFADLLVIDGNPLRDLGVLAKPERTLLAIMKGGRFYKNRLH
jgi:imidazolonepropionase-like amidohydrolase